MTRTPDRRVAKQASNSYILHMTASNEVDDAKARKTALAARRIAQAAEGLVAMADYRREQQTTVDRMAALRAERLARQALAPAPSAKKPTRKLGGAIAKKSAKKTA